MESNSFCTSAKGDAIALTGEVDTCWPQDVFQVGPLECERSVLAASNFDLMRGGAEDVSHAKIKRNPISCARKPVRK